MLIMTKKLNKKILKMTIKIKDNPFFNDLQKVFSGNIVAQVIGFISTVIITRNLGPEDYGVFSLLLALFTVAVQLSDFGISTSYVKYASKDKIRAKKLFKLIIIVKVFLSIFIVFIVQNTSSFVAENLFENRKFENLINITAFAILFHGLFTLVLAYYQSMEKFKIFAYLSVFHNVIKAISIIILTIIFAEKASVESYYYIYSYSAVMALLVAIIFLRKDFLDKESFIKEDFEIVWSIYKMGFWVFLSSISVIIMMRLDLMMLKNLDSTLEVGLYSAGLSLAMILPLMSASLTTVLFPKMDRFLNALTINQYIYKILENLKYIIIFAFIVIFAAPMLVPFMFGDDYDGAISVFQILVVGFSVSMILNPVSLVLYSINKSHILTVVNWIQLPLNFVGNLIMIPILSADGAALSSVLIRVLAAVFVINYLLGLKDD